MTYSPKKNIKCYTFGLILCVTFSKILSQVQKWRRSQNKYNHRISRKGYARFQEDYVSGYKFYYLITILISLFLKIDVCLIDRNV